MADNVLLYQKIDNALISCIGDGFSTDEHANLKGLEYADSGHIGFASSDDLETKSDKAVVTSVGDIATISTGGNFADSGKTFGGTISQESTTNDISNNYNVYEYIMQQKLVNTEYQGLFDYFGTQTQIEAQTAEIYQTAIAYVGVLRDGVTDVLRGNYDGSQWNFAPAVPTPENGMWMFAKKLLNETGTPFGMAMYKSDGVNPITFDTAPFPMFNPDEVDITFDNSGNLTFMDKSIVTSDGVVNVLNSVTGQNIIYNDSMTLNQKISVMDNALINYNGRFVNKSTTLANATDLNTVLTSDFYRIGSNVVNGPTQFNASTCPMEVIVTQNTFKQTIWDINSTLIAHRSGFVSNIADIPWTIDNDFQQKTISGDSGKVLTGGTTSGTFGTSLGIDSAPVDGSQNLISSGAAKLALDGKVGATIAIRDTDLGTVLEKGFYRLHTGCTGGPNGVDIAYANLIVVRSGTNDTLAQMLFTYRADRLIFYRTATINTIATEPWKEITTTDTAVLKLGDIMMGTLEGAVKSGSNISTAKTNTAFKVSAQTSETASQGLFTWMTAKGSAYVLMNTGSTINRDSSLIYVTKENYDGYINIVKNVFQLVEGRMLIRDGSVPQLSDSLNITDFNFNPFDGMTIQMGDMMPVRSAATGVLNHPWLGYNTAGYITYTSTGATQSASIFIFRHGGTAAVAYRNYNNGVWESWTFIGEKSKQLTNAILITDFNSLPSALTGSLTAGTIMPIYFNPNTPNAPWSDSGSGYIEVGWISTTFSTTYTVHCFRGGGDAGGVNNYAYTFFYNGAWQTWKYVNTMNSVGNINIAGITKNPDANGNITITTDELKTALGIT